MSWYDFVVELHSASQLSLNFSLTTCRVKLKVSVGEKAYVTDWMLVSQSKSLNLNKRLLFKRPTASRVKFELFQVSRFCKPVELGAAEVELAALVRGCETRLPLLSSKKTVVANVAVKMFFHTPKNVTANVPEFHRQNQVSFADISEDRAESTDYTPSSFTEQGSPASPLHDVAIDQKTQSIPQDQPITMMHATPKTLAAFPETLPRRSSV